MNMKLLAAGSFFALAFAAPATSGRNVDSYRLYAGTADSGDWPVESLWFPTFDSM